MLTLLTTQECHLCDHARRVLERLRRDGAVTLREIRWDSAEGQELVHRDGIPFPPAVYLGDSLAGYGRISERALRRRLEAC